MNNGVYLADCSQKEIRSDIYAILENDIEGNYLYPSMLSFNKEKILSEINLITEEKSKGRGVIYLGKVSLKKNDICNTNSDFILLEEWRPQFGQYGKWKHSILNK